MICLNNEGMPVEVSYTERPISDTVSGVRPGPVDQATLIWTDSATRHNVNFAMMSYALQAAERLVNAGAGIVKVHRLVSGRWEGAVEFEGYGDLVED